MSKDPNDPDVMCGISDEELTKRFIEAVRRTKWQRQDYDNLYAVSYLQEEKRQGILLVK